ncbi:MAG: PIN domain-containing protein [Verrucomicrobiales bacterium]|nr:PIN domain-containing protein [Verrucomicrobiales bacterium]
MTAIADTGFIVAFLNARDEHHAWAAGLAEQVTVPLVTCEAVLTEAAYLLNDVRLVMELLASGLVEVKFNLTANRVHLAELADRFGDQHPDLCDLCVVRMSELFPDHAVLTTDRKDFAVYRRNKRDRIPAIFPPEK